MIDMIIVEGDTTMAQMTCGCCKRFFRADYTRVTCADKQPICLSCIDKYNPMRVERGMSPMPVDRTAYSE